MTAIIPTVLVLMVVQILNNTDSVTVRDAWYTADGPENDVVISSRVRLARNLANFLFPQFAAQNELERVQSLVFGSFSNIQQADNYQAVCIKNLDKDGRSIFVERGVISPDISDIPTAGIIVRTDGQFSCTVNDVDHIRLASFSSGLDLQKSYDVCKNVDEQLQKTLQFAASFDFGYLNSSIADTGTGMKVSVRLHLPSVSHSGILQELIAQIPSWYNLTSCYGSGSEKNSALGSFYQLSSAKCFPDCEYEQIDGLCAAAIHLTEIERKARAEFADSKPTILKDIILRSYADAKYSRLLSCRDAICLISDLKWGVDSGILEGVSDSILTSLLYRIQPMHLNFVNKTGCFNYEKDIATEGMKINRLRSLVIQEQIEKLQIGRHFA